MNTCERNCFVKEIVSTNEPGLGDNSDPGSFLQIAPNRGRQHPKWRFAKVPDVVSATQKI